MRILFIGDPLLVDGYRLSDIEVAPVSTPEELLGALDSAFKRDDLGMILVDSDYSSQVKDRIEDLKLKRAMPVLVEVPGRRTSADIDFKEIVSRIMGIKV